MTKVFVQTAMSFCCVVVAGIVLVFFLTLFNFRITKGTIGGLIYANLVHINSNFYFPLKYSLPRARACAAGVWRSAVSLFVCLSALFWAVFAFEERSRARLNPDR